MRTRSPHRFNKALTLMLGVGTLAGVLIWAKLRLVTDIPRTVLAEPEDELSPKDSDPSSIDSHDHDNTAHPEDPSVDDDDDDQDDAQPDVPEQP